MSSPPPARTTLLTWAGMALAALTVALTWVRGSESPVLLERAALGRIAAESGAPRAEPLSFAVETSRFVSAHVLYDRAVHALAQQFGFGVVRAAHLALAAFCAAWWFRWAARLAPGWGSFYALLLLLGAARFRLSEIGPHIADWGWMTLAMHLLRRPWRRPWARWAALLPVQIAWANTGVLAVAGPLFAIGWAGEELSAGGGAERPGAPPKLHLLLPLGLFAVCGVTPYGWASVRALFLESNSLLGLLGHGWMVAAVGRPEMLAMYVTMAALILCLLVRRQRLPLLWLMAAVVGVYLLFHRRPALHTAALLTLPFLALSFDTLSEELRRFFLRRLRYPLAAPPGVHAALATLGALLVLLSPMQRGAWEARGYVRHPDPAGPDRSPLSPVLSEALRRPDAPRRLLHAPADGGALAWTRPDARIFADTRDGVYPAEFQKEVWEAWIDEPAKVMALAERWSADGLLLRCALPSGQAHAMEFAGRPGIWALAWFDGTHMLWVRREAVAATFWRDRALQRAGLDRLERERERLTAARGRTGVSEPATGAGLFFLATRRYPLAADFLGLALRHAPALTPLRFPYATALLETGRVDEARAAVQDHLKSRPNDPAGWMLLARIEAKRGDEPAARAAQLEAERLRPRPEPES